mgnify:CR=1 FL=1
MLCVIVPNLAPICSLWLIMGRYELIGPGIASSQVSDAGSGCAVVRYGQWLPNSR